MYVERILYPVVSLGIGQRIGIWLQGCNHRCYNCISKEMWVQKEENNININILLNNVRDIVKYNQVDGITISGGDPFFQKDELLTFLKEVSKLKLEILVYTGYLYEEIKNFNNGQEILSYIDILIDGRYIDELNYNDLTLRGSANQVIYYKNKEIEKKYEKYINEGRVIQIFTMEDYVVSIGIHNKEKGENNCE